MPRRLSVLAWLAALTCVAFVLLGACDLPSTRVPVATRVVTVETPEDLSNATETMRAQGCILTHLAEDPAGPFTWAVFACVDLGRAVSPVPGL